MFIYHYFAQRHTVLAVTNIDGIAWMDEPIRGMAGYRKLKEVIVKDFNLPSNELVIHSLTPLGEIEGGDVDKI